MKEAFVHPGTVVKLTDSPIPTPGPDEVVIKVSVCGSNPKDWKYVEWFQRPLNSGDDIAGTVHQAGSNVYALRQGDRIAAFHCPWRPHGAFAEFAVAPAHMVLPLPPGLSFEEAATLPLTSATAAYALFITLGCAMPWSDGRFSGLCRPSARAPEVLTSPFKWVLPQWPRDEGLDGLESEPLLVWGGATAVGAYAIQIARRAKLSPIIAIAGQSAPFVSTLLDPSAGDTVIDYRQSTPAILAAIRAVLPPGKPLRLAFDAVSSETSMAACLSLLADTPRARLAVTNPETEPPASPSNVTTRLVVVPEMFDVHSDFARAWWALLRGGIEEGWLRAHPHRVVPGGLGGLQEGLRLVREGRVNGQTLVFRVAETEGLS